MERIWDEWKAFPSITVFPSIPFRFTSIPRGWRGSANHLSLPHQIWQMRTAKPIIQKPLTNKNELMKKFLFLSLVASMSLLNSHNSLAQAPENDDYLMQDGFYFSREQSSSIAADTALYQGFLHDGTRYLVHCNRREDYAPDSCIIQRAVRGKEQALILVGNMEPQKAISHLEAYVKRAGNVEKTPLYTEANFYRFSGVMSSFEGRIDLRIPVVPAVHPELRHTTFAIQHFSNICLLSLFLDTHLSLMKAKPEWPTSVKDVTVYPNFVLDGTDRECLCLHIDALPGMEEQAKADIWNCLEMIVDEKCTEIELNVLRENLRRMASMNYYLSPIYVGDGKKLGNHAIIKHLADAYVLGNDFYDISAEGEYFISSSASCYSEFINAMYEATIKNYKTDVSIPEEIHQLDQVVVTSRIPKTKITGNSIETRIVGSDLEHAGTAEDVLAKTPGIVKQGEELTVIGRGAPVYYINGRRVQDADELKRLNSEQIKNIEVINNPGADYDVTVNAVVKIRTVRQQGEGLSMDLKSQVRQTLTYGDTDPGASIALNYRHKNVDVFGSTNLWTNHFDRWNQIGGGTFTKALTHEQRGWMDVHQRGLGLEYKLGVNWQINDLHSLGIMAHYYHNPYVKGSILTDETTMRNGAFEDHLIADDQYTLLRHRGFSANAYYSGKVGVWSIDWNFDFMNQVHREKNDIFEQSLIHDNQLSTEGDRHNELYAGKLSLQRPWGKGLFKWGSEDTYVISRNRYSTLSDLLPTSSSEMRELTLALFAEYSLASAWGQWVAGLRYEHVDMQYDDLQNADKAQHRTQDNLFPFLSWSRPFGPWSLSLNYAIRTRRPTYWQLRDAMEYHSRYIYEAGNPHLRNTINQTLSLTGNYKWLVFGADYLHAARKILQWAEPYNQEGTVVLKTQNLVRPVQSYSLYAIAHPTWGCWSPNYTVGITQQFLTLDLIDDREPTGIRTASFNKPMFLVQANNVWRVGSSQSSQPWQLELNLQHRSRMNHDNDEMQRAIWSLDAAIQKSFLDGNLTFRLSANDLLNHTQEAALVDYGNYLVYQYSDYKKQALEFSVHYRFNAARSKYKGSGAGEDAKSRM